MKKYLLIVIIPVLFSLKSNTIEEIKSFKDCENCPEMVEVPEGSVYIGSHEDEIGRKKGERNRVKATIKKPFAVAKTEITLAQYRVFMEETKYKSKQAFYKGEPLVGCNYFDGKSYGYVAEHNWKNPGYPQRETDPVVCVSWSDANAYAQWLSKKTGRTYRVPSAVEFEYASRAGSSSPWYWGTDPAEACDYANVGDKAFAKKFPTRASFPCTDGYVFTTRVGRFKPNKFGLFDMVGNAWEWTSDCFQNDLTNAPVDGSAWVDNENNECDARTPKGGSWISGISWGRAAVRSRDGADYKSFMLGFRVAAEIKK
ncbi:formylglycine-generating enzyme required for sulfatase activity [Maribacter vaceletii]|uniref:Formylglycine-generating enzyme required for sulfatase activity n=1 Tax=Maribacter vaceletii TaxID=1206816 RepID=A0A495EE92_9FLAO|nr:SUMF1/EgtB/PvdO family nonheme iron enzyme [Maribacter vaceletii]RKR15240.1 formylglycine-generating enzyme required for sulfatase activity [Maribacter vaceletii]